MLFSESGESSSVYFQPIPGLGILPLSPASDEIEETQQGDTSTTIVANFQPCNPEPSLARLVKVIWLSRFFFHIVEFRI